MPQISTIEGSKKRLMRKKVINTADLELLGDFILDKEITPEEAEKILNGKKTIKTNMRSPRSNGKVVFTEEGNVITMFTKKKEKVGDILWSPQEFMGMGVMLLHEIVVRDEFRGEGFGTRLMEYLEEKAKAKGNSDPNRFRGIILEVDSFNERAHNFFLKRGYKEIGYNNDVRVDRVQMMKEL